MGTRGPPTGETLAKLYAHKHTKQLVPPPVHLLGISQSWARSLAMDTTQGIPQVTAQLGLQRTPARGTAQPHNIPTGPHTGDPHATPPLHNNGNAMITNCAPHGAHRPQQQRQGGPMTAIASSALAARTIPPTQTTPAGAIAQTAPPLRQLDTNRATCRYAPTDTRRKRHKICVWQSNVYVETESSRDLH